MAILHIAQLRPSKMELLGQWLATRSWYRGPVDPQATALAAFRFDDPAGEVGVETHLVRVGDGPLLQVPVTYRGAPLPGAEKHLVGTIDHSVLGHRWVYDGDADPVYIQCVTSAIVNATSEAAVFVEVDGVKQQLPTSAQVLGTGGAAAHNWRLTVIRTPLEPDETVGTAPALLGTWDGVPSPVVLAYLTQA